MPHESPIPFVHSAPSGTTSSGANPRATTSSPRSRGQRLASASGSKSPRIVPRSSIARQSPFGPLSPIASSTPLDQGEMLAAPSQILPSQDVPPSAQPHQSQAPSSSSREDKPSPLPKRGLSFGDALSPAKKSRATTDITTGVTFGFGS